jgi:peptide/nickel transport system substrate-binding protein
VALAVLAVAAWLAFGDSITGSESESSVRFVEAEVGTPSRVNPLFAHLNDADRDLVALTFSGLTRLSGDGTVLPDLAESWEIDEAGQTVTFHLREGVTFHTGASFSAADVVFTYGLLADPNLQGDPEQAPLWRQVHCSDPELLTVVCQLPAPFAPFLAHASIGILPQSMLAGVDGAAIFDNPFNQSPIGTGPFRLAQLADGRAVLRPHAAYHLGVPAIDEFVMEFYPEVSGAVSAVVRGDADAILIDATVGEDEQDELATAGGLKTYSTNRTAYTALYLNNSEAPLNDQVVRSAIAQAIDVDAIIGETVGSLAAAATSPMIPGTWAFNPDVESYEHDKEDARAILEQAGWVLPEDGEVRLKNDTELAIRLMAERDPVRNALASRVADELRDVGIDVTVEVQDSATLVSESLIPREYQAAIFGWDQGLDPDPYPAWHSSQAGANGRNLSDYQSDAADALMEDARRSFDLDQRQSLYFSFQEIFHNDFPSVVLYYPVYNYFVRDNVGGLELGTLFHTSSRFRNVHEWTIEDQGPIAGGD